MATRFVKPKIDKYIQLYSKNAYVEEGLFNGKVTSIEITNPGYWYDDGSDETPYLPTVTIGAPDISGGTQATATAVVGEAPYYSISSINITNQGTGYTRIPTVTITAPEMYPDSDDTNDGVVFLFPENGGSGYTSAPTITISAPDIAGGTQATATATISDGVVTGATMTVFGSGYTTIPTVTLSGGGGSGAVLRALLTRGEGATASASITVEPTRSNLFTWTLNTPVEVNENALLQVVDRQFTGIASADEDKPIVIRMHDISSKSVVNTLNQSRNNQSFNVGTIIDMGKPDRKLPNDIKLEIQPENIHKLTLSVNQGLSTNVGIDSDIEFIIILRVIEKEPSLIEYGSLNNIDINQNIM